MNHDARQDDLLFLTELTFPDCDVLSNPRDQRIRKARLLQAAAQGNDSGAEVELILQDDFSCRQIRTRVLAAGDDRVLVDKGISIPLACISRVQILLS
ncbi:MAG: hypothetical protein ACK5XV_11825 [Flavobacteriales bacterium]|jgi:hypothetical protein